MFAPADRDLMGLIKSTFVNAASGVGGRYLYYKFIGNPLSKAVAPYLGNYANIGASAIYSIVANLLSAKYVGSEFWSNFIQNAGMVPLADYIAKALGDPLGGQSAASTAVAGTGVSATEAAEEQQVLAMITGQNGGPVISTGAARGYD